ncbi:hypothetical protein MC885_019119 [Smutsia gigantea]|nr:hypothetical protein MC885_019119 [Smutsia gigantea]
MGRGPPAGPGGAVLPSGAAAAASQSQGASGGSARKAGRSAAAAAAAAPSPRSPGLSASQAAPATRPAMSLSGASERSVPATKIEITVSCRNLLDLDTFSKSDPSRRHEGREGRLGVRVRLRGGERVGADLKSFPPRPRSRLQWWCSTRRAGPAKSGGRPGADSPPPTQFGRTEVIDNTLNPDFVRKFVLDYFFEEKQNLRFDVYNVDSKTNISKPDFLGQAFLALGEVIGGQGSRVERPLAGVPGKKCGTILLTAEELSNCRDIATMQLCANKLDKKDFFGKSDPFLVFYRSNEDGTFTICHKTEVVKNTLNPVWQPFSIPVRALCNGDYDRTVKIDVYDWDRDGSFAPLLAPIQWPAAQAEERDCGNKRLVSGLVSCQQQLVFTHPWPPCSHDFIGEFTTSYRELSKAQNQFTVYEVLNPRKKCKKKKYVNSGTVTLLSFSVDSEFTFVDYIKGGTQLNFTVAIDFTASNGNPLQPTSLHYMSPYQLSAYAMALKAVGEIIQDYDSDKLFPAYGFGAKLPPEGRISHQFPLNNNDEDPSCVGIEGVLESYFQSLRTVQLYGPTYFAPVINQVARVAAKISDGSQYYVLLIITDGASSLPMSIIIVGVGPAMFEAMEELDGDDVRVSSRGRYAERDIVQFVPFRDYVDRSGNQVLSMARLAKDVLAEIPEQLLSYMRTRDIQPRPRPAANPSPSPVPEQP